MPGYPCCCRPVKPHGCAIIYHNEVVLDFGSGGWITTQLGWKDYWHTEPVYSCGCSDVSGQWILDTMKTLWVSQSICVQVKYHPAFGDWSPACYHPGWCVLVELCELDEEYADHPVSQCLQMWLRPLIIDGQFRLALLVNTFLKATGLNCLGNPPPWFSDYGRWRVAKYANSGIDPVLRYDDLFDENDKFTLSKWYDEGGSGFLSTCAGELPDTIQGWFL